MPSPSKFGQRLLEARNQRGLTQEQLAEKARIPAAVISHFETGVRSNASADNLVKLADALRVTVDYLLGRSDDMVPAVSDLDRRAAQLTEDKREILDSLVDALARRARPEPETRKK